MADITLATVISGVTGYLLGKSFDHQIDFSKKQFELLYSPACSLVKEIRAFTDIQISLHSQATTENEKNNSFAEYNNQFDNEIIPKYKELLKLITDNYGLAENEIQREYKKFYEFVNGMKLKLNNSINTLPANYTPIKETCFNEMSNHIEEYNNKLSNNIKNPLLLFCIIYANIKEALILTKNSFLAKHDKHSNSA